MSETIRYVDPIAIRREIQALVERLDPSKPREFVDGVQRWQDKMEDRMSRLPYADAMAVKAIVEAEVSLQVKMRQAAFQASPEAIPMQPQPRYHTRTILWCIIGAVLLVLMLTAKHG